MMIVKKVIVMDPLYRGGVGESMEPRLHAEEIDAPDGFIEDLPEHLESAAWQEMPSTKKTHRMRRCIDSRLHCWVRLLHRR